VKSRIELTVKLAEVFVNTEGNMQMVLNGASKPEGPVTLILEGNGIVTDGLAIGEEWRVRLERVGAERFDDAASVRRQFEKANEIVERLGRRTVRLTWRLADTMHARCSAADANVLDVGYVLGHGDELVQVHGLAGIVDRYSYLGQPCAAFDVVLERGYNQTPKVAHGEADWTIEVAPKR